MISFAALRRVASHIGRNFANLMHVGEARVTHKPYAGNRDNGFSRTELLRILVQLASDCRRSP